MTERVNELVPGLVRGHKADGRCVYDRDAKRELVKRCLEPGVSVAGMALAQQVNGRRCRRVAGYDQRLDAVHLQQLVHHRERAIDDERVTAFAIRRIARIREVDEVLARQLAHQRAQHAQAPDAAVEDPDRGLGPRLAHAAATAMFLNSPVAMRFCHSAGPVMWALVPPASTATVTGMSTTSNS